MQQLRTPQELKEAVYDASQFRYSEKSKRYIAEASDLGLPPLEFSQQVSRWYPHWDYAASLSNLAAMCWPDGELESVWYKWRFGIEMCIFND
jgi:hypothetical protein